MRRPSLLLAAALAALGATAPSASAQAPFGPCPDAGFAAFECATLNVPLDRAGAVPGQVPLFVRRLRSQPGAAPTRTALVALAGGPGQAATPAAASFATALAPGIRERDLLVLDQRGTGRSGPLSCNALRGRQTVTAITRCGQELGAARGFYRTGDSVEDLEALRVAAGYDQLAFYGVSYGTKVALDYAARHPAQVERLVLDSVVPPAGPDPLQRSSFRSVRGVLGELCAGRRCNGVTPDPVGDIRTLIRRDRTIRGDVRTASGRRVRVRVRPQDIYEILSAGDLNPAWRAMLPGAVRAARRGDGTPLARLGVAALGGVSGGSVTTATATASALQRDDAGVNQALFLATACEDITFPWNRASSPGGRAQQATQALRREPSSTFSPFDRLTAAGSGVLGQCLGWPNATPTPGPDAATFPGVPTLIINGAADLRTPNVDAAAVAGRIPGAQLVTVPNVGHSVLGSDPTGCAGAAIAGFFSGAGVTPCPAAEPAVAPTRRPVRSLGELPTTARLRGRVGRTVSAVLRTQQDVLVHALGERLSGGRSRFGGLRGGTISQTPTGAVTLRKVVVVPGVTVSGRFPEQGDARLAISGRAAADGTLTITRDGRVTGRLAGRRINLIPRAAAASARPKPFRFRHPALVPAAR
jgi:pimeloyl-ACP methyl ester carboxylesterase